MEATADTKVEENYQDKEFQAEAAPTDPYKIPRDVMLFYVDLYQTL